MIRNAEAKLINGLKLGLCNTMTSYPGAGATSNKTPKNKLSRLKKTKCAHIVPKIHFEINLKNKDDVSFDNSKYPISSIINSSMYKHI